MLYKRRSHCVREIHHSQSLAPDADLFEHCTDPIRAFARPQVAFNKMAASFQATDNQDAINSKGKTTKHLAIACRIFWSFNFRMDWRQQPITPISATLESDADFFTRKYI
jgi:hypothetical protein